MEHQHQVQQPFWQPIVHSPFLSVHKRPQHPHTHSQSDKHINYGMPEIQVIQQKKKNTKGVQLKGTCTKAPKEWHHFFSEIS